MAEALLPRQALAAARQEAEAMAAELAGVKAVVIASVDGFDLASATRGGGCDPRRIAALASSLAAIGEVVSRETGLGRGTRITVGTEDGFAVVCSVPRQDLGLVIQVVAGADAVLAQVNYRATEAARRLAQA